MFQLMKKVAVEAPTTTRNEYGEKIPAYTDLGTTEMFISFVTVTQKLQENVQFDDYTHIGLTTDNKLEKKMLIDSRYEVMYVLPSKPFNRIFLKEVENLWH